LQSILKHPERLVMWNKVRAIMPSKVIVFEETELTVKLGKKTMIVYMADGRKAEFNTISEKESDRKGPTFTPELKLEGALSDFSISIDGHWLKRLLGKVKSPFDSKVIPEC
jgi:hypothetical protein